MKFRRFKLFFIEIPFLLFIMLLTYLTISYFPADVSSPDMYADYSASLLAFIGIPITLFLFIFLLFIVTSVQTSPHHSKKHLTKRATKYFFGLLVLLALSFPLSFFATYAYAFVQINYNILSYNFGKSEKQFMTTPQAVADEIAITDELTITNFSPATYKKELMLIAMKKKSGFYEEYVLPSFPNILYKRSYLPPTTVAYVNKHLAFSELTPDQLAVLSPALGKFLIEYSTEQSIIKPMPQIAILDKASYVDARIATMEKSINQIDKAIGSIDGSIASISGYIASNEESISSNTEIKQNALKQKEAVTCKTPAKCDSQKAKWDRIIKQADTNIAKAQAALNQNQAILGTSTKNKENLQGAITTLTAAEALTEKELGLFNPDNKIVMTIDDINNPEVFDTYLITLIHEYFHYLSYSNEETKLDSFFEEGLTEYFSRMAFENYTGRKIDVGYQVGVRIITEMTKKIPEKELLAIYYTKDQKRLETVLNKTYGEKFYQDNISAFNMLNLLPFEESVKVANLIMPQIGGEQLQITEVKRNSNFKIPAPEITEDAKVGEPSKESLPGIEEL